MKKELPQKPKSTIVDGRIVYVCCPPCADKVEANPAATPLSRGGHGGHSTTCRSGLCALYGFVLLLTVLRIGDTFECLQFSREPGLAPNG